MIHFFNNKREITYLADGNFVVFSVNVVLETYCSMKFENYPIDNHTCGIYFQSWSNNASDVSLTSGFLLFEKDFNLLDYSFNVQTVPNGSEIKAIMNYSKTGFEIKL